MKKIGIIGGTGYTGLELIKILTSHPKVTLQTVTSRAKQGKLIGDVFPSLNKLGDIRFSDLQSGGLQDCDLVFSAAPSGIAMQHAEVLLQSNIKLIDLSADFRLKDVSVWERWYGMQHSCPQLLGQAVYGLPEVNRALIKQAKIVANPGCYPTAVQLGFLPLIENRLVDQNRLIADAKSGVSGAGRKEDLSIMYCELTDSFKAYAISGHRHLPEIEQGLKHYCSGDEQLKVVFTPHLVPMIRGIHSTLYADLLDPAISLEDIHAIYAKRFNDEPFVELLPPEKHPETRNVRGTNICQMAIHRPQNGNTLVVLSVEDNLVKGAAGQAVQNMNLMFGFDETLGLNNLAMVP